MRKPMKKLPSVHDRLNLAKRFIDTVPVRDKRMKVFQMVASEALKEAILMLAPSAYARPCPGQILPKNLEPYPLLLPCKSRIVQRQVRQMLREEIEAIRTCPVQVLPRTARG